MPDGVTPDAAEETKATEQDSSEQQGTTEPVDSSTADWQSKYERAVSEAIAERKKRQQAEARVGEFEKAAMSEAERTKAEAEEARREAEAARSELRRTRVEYAVRAKASEMGVVDPEAAFRLLDTSEFDPDDQKALGKQVESALNELVSRKPYLKGITNATSPANGSTRATKGLSAEELRKMTQDEVAALWKDRPDDVLAALKEQR